MVPGADGDQYPAAASSTATQRRRQVPCEACDSLEPGSACSRCLDLGIECTFDTSRKPYARRSLPKNGDTAAKTEPEVGEPVKVDTQKLLCGHSSLLGNIPTLGLATPPAAHEDTPSQPAYQDTPPGNPARDSNGRPLPCDCWLQPSCSSCKLKGLRCEYIYPTKEVPWEKSQTKKDEGSEMHSNVSCGPTPPPVLVEKAYCADASVTSSKMSVSFMLE
ncbi:hypothetical protein BJ741DRAFT_629880 [Chytriomyces cf. hyalinus JEL632]|nr:hypothetical protein BJ741DRAFT_629880 [Chytriomyces cf. hyalinus JEL632]